MAVVGVIVKSVTLLPSWIFMLILELGRMVKGQCTAVDIDPTELNLRNGSALTLKFTTKS